tara:strand:+ start:354 stop:578 length:225 start_codon:yes stop_codon:yes gene_type:complete
MRNLLFIVLLVVGISCEKNEEKQGCIDPNLISHDQVCIEIYQPVCGCDLKTYANSCFAKINGLTDWTAGECVNN